MTMTMTKTKTKTKTKTMHTVLHENEEQQHVRIKCMLTNPLMRSRTTHGGQLRSIRCIAQLQRSRSNMHTLTIHAAACLK